MSKERKKLFEVAVLYHDEITNQQGIITEIDTQIIVSPTVVIATNPKEAEFIANRLVPQEFAECPELLELRIRPF